MLGDGCTCGLGWVRLTVLPDRGARHPSLQGNCGGPPRAAGPQTRLGTASVWFPVPESFPGAAASLTHTPHVPILPLGLACVWSLSLGNQ